MSKKLCDECRDYSREDDHCMRYDALAAYRPCLDVGFLGSALAMAGSYREDLKRFLGSVMDNDESIPVIIFTRYNAVFNCIEELKLAIRKGKDPHSARYLHRIGGLTGHTQDLHETNEDYEKRLKELVL